MYASNVIVKGGGSMPSWDFRRSADFADAFDLSSPRVELAPGAIGRCRDIEENSGHDGNSSQAITEDSDDWRGVEDTRVRSRASSDNFGTLHEVVPKVERDHDRSPTNLQSWRFCA